MQTSVKVATWNLCLGLPNKKDFVLNEIELNRIDVCCMQETEIDINDPKTFFQVKLMNLNAKKAQAKEESEYTLTDT